MFAESLINPGDVRTLTGRTKTDIYQRIGRRGFTKMSIHRFEKNLPYAAKKVSVNTYIDVKVYQIFSSSVLGGAPSRGGKFN
jgi:hypothetical protein